MQYLRETLSPRIWGLLCLLLFCLIAINPELLSFVLIVNAIGFDVFFLLLVLQFRQYLDFFYRAVFQRIEVGLKYFYTGLKLIFYRKG